MKIVTYDDVDPDSVYRLMSTSFGWGGMTASAVRRERRDDPRCFEGFAFYAVADGRPVAQVIPFRMRVRLTTGIETIGAIAGVCSHPSTWGQGYARKTMDRAHEWFREEGLRIAALTTSRNIRGYGVYQRMGYRELGPFFRAYRTLPRKRPHPKGVRFRRARTSDSPLIVRLFATSTRDLLGWTVRNTEEFRSSLAWHSRSIARYRVVLREGAPVAYFRTRPFDDVLFDELVAPREEDFRAAIALLEAEARPRISVTDWVTAQRDQDRLRAAGYELDGPIPDTTMVLPLDGQVATADLAAAFGVGTRTFAHYPSEDF